MKKALIITGKYVQDHEFIYPFYRFQEAGFEVTVATDDGEDTLGFWGTKVPVDTSFNTINVDDYDLIIIPGGAKSLEYLRQDQKVLDIIKKYFLWLKG